MHRIADRLYLAKCSECRVRPGPGRTLIYACGRPCESVRGPAQDLAACPAEEFAADPAAGAHVHLLGLQNSEIPHYRREDLLRGLDLIGAGLDAGEVHLLSERCESRAPSLALLWLALRARTLSRSSFAAARSDFMRLFPAYVPWPSWTIFLHQEWEQLA
jgi:hypothetical protein